MGKLVMVSMFVLQAGEGRYVSLHGASLGKRSISELFQEAWKSHDYNPTSNADTGRYR